MSAVALVIGAGDATGGAIARRFAAGGYTVCATAETRTSSSLCWTASRPRVARRKDFRPMRARKSQPRDAWTHELDLRPCMKKF